MEGERFAPPHSSSSSRENPRPLVSGLIVDRFRSMLREIDDVVEIYAELLSELTINSKPIITELTIIAGEQREHGDGIADVICGRILEVPEDQKLPSLYLLDSIVKNIGREYVKYFSLRLPKVFSEAYNQVNSNMHRAMRHLFGTWSQVFPSSVLRKIEDKLQFTSTENKLPAGVASVRNSESPHPSHGIHVNPKYLEAQRQIQHASAMRVTGAHKIVQTAECDEDDSERLASVSPKGSGASPNFQDTEHAIGNSSRLKGYGHSSSTQYGSYNFDHSEVVSLHTGKSKVGSPRSAAACTSVAEPEGPNHHLNAKVSMPLSPRTRPGRSASPIDDRLTGDSSPWMAADRASAPYSQPGFEPGRAVDQNGLVNRSIQFDVGVSQLNASTAYDPNIRYGKKHPRELIDTYGNSKGQITSLEKPPKPQRVKMNGINGEATTRNWKSFEEEEYVWEDMSQTLAYRTGKNSLPPLGPNSVSLSRRFGLNRPDSSILEHDPRGSNLQNQTKLLSSDAAVTINDDRISGVRFGHGAIQTKPPDGGGVQSEQFQHPSSLHFQDPGKFPYDFQHRSREFSSDSWERSPQFIPSVSAIITAVNGQKPLAACDNTPGIQSPFQRSPDLSSGSEYAETSVPEKHLALRSLLPSVAPITLPPVYKSQPLPLNPSPPHLKPLNSPVLRGPNPPMFSPQQHFQGSYTEISISNRVLPMYHQQSGLVHSNLQIHEQGNGIKTQSQDAYGGYVPSVPAQLSSHFFTQPLNSLQTQGQGVPVGSLPNSFSGLTSSIAMYTNATSLPRPGGILPPLPPGPPPESSQVGPASQNSGSLISGSPVSAFSGLISTLMAQGLISLTPPAQLEEASRELEFKSELLKVRHESAIDALYGNLPRQCTTCGLRFKCQEEHSSHMDWHVTKNRISKNRKQKPSRKWFVNTKEWLSGAETVGTDIVPFLPSETALEKKEDEEMAVPADENQTECALCGEPFEDFYSDEADEWMYKGAVYLNAPNGQMSGLDQSHLGPIVHAKCRSDTNDGP